MILKVLILSYFNHEDVPFDKGELIVRDKKKRRVLLHTDNSIFLFFQLILDCSKLKEEISKYFIVD